MGVGFDQFVVIEKGIVDVYLVFYNVDGLILVVCGNVICCIVCKLMMELGCDVLMFIMECGMFYVKDVGDGLILINMGYL